jgi:hypothetical protein
MSRKPTYYEIGAVLRYAGPRKSWPEWPHIYFANMNIDEASLRAFQYNFGPFRKGAVPVPVAKRLQQKLREAWKWAATHKAVQSKVAVYFPPLIMSRGEVEITAPDLSTFIYVALARDATLGRAKICANPDCKCKYFVQPTARKKLFCSHACAGLMSVRDFRKRAAKKGR